MYETQKRILELVTHAITYPASRVAICEKWYNAESCGDYYIPELDLTARVWIDCPNSPSQGFTATACTIKL
jgi:hypothetical protein